MKRVLLKHYPYPHSSEAWLQTKFLWTWWITKVKIGSIDECVDWSLDQNCPIIDYTDID
jgi:hypothetical protein